jgi:hypothetical protein
MRGHRFGAEPHAGEKLLQARQLGGIALQPAGGQPVAQGGLV